MAQATSIIPFEWSDEDRWTLDEVHDHLTKTLGYAARRALDEMERHRFRGRLPIKVQKVVDGRPEGDPFYLPFDRKHELGYSGGRVSPKGLPWGNFSFRCTVSRHRVLELWPSRSRAFQQQAEDKAGPEPEAAERPSTGQSPQTPLTSKEWLKGEIERREKLDDIPKEITEFSEQIHSEMVKAVRAGIVDKLIKPRTIETYLRLTKHFPKKKRSPKS